MNRRVFADVNGARVTRCARCSCTVAAFTPVFGLETTAHSGRFGLVCVECGMEELEGRAAAMRMQHGRFCA